MTGVQTCALPIFEDPDNRPPPFTIFTEGSSKLPFFQWSTVPGATCPGAGRCWTKDKEKRGDGKRAPKSTDDATIIATVDQLKSAKGGQGALLRALGMNVFIAGESLLIGMGEGKDQTWEGLSIDELLIRNGDKTLYRKVTPYTPPKPLPPDTLVIRCWQEHPRYSGFPDSAMRSILDECEKLLLLTRADKAAARSRFAGSGLLFVPNELVPVAQQPEGDESQPNAQQNPVLTELARAMIEPIKDESHPSAVVPVVLFGPAEYGEKINYISFERQMDRMSASRREEAITRIATAIDLPNEILTGKADLNHWTSWQIHEETFQAHLQPFVELICDALTVGYLQPALKKAGVDNPEKYVIWYDDSELVVRPDRTELAAALYADNIISADARLREAGFEPDDKMGDDEKAKRIGLLLKDPKMALTGKPTEAPPAGPPGAGGEQAGPGRPSNFGGDAANAPSQASGDPIAPDRAKASAPSQSSPTKKASAASTSKSKPSQPSPVANTARPGSEAANREQKNRRGLTASAGDPVTELGRQLAQLDIGLMMKLRTAADEVMSTALSRAGARIRSKAPAPTKATIKDTPNHLVASVLGPSVVIEMGLDTHDLLKGSFTEFSIKVAAWLAAAQAARSRLIARFAQEHPDINDGGIDEGDLDKIYGQRDKTARDLALAALVTGLMGLAMDRLYSPDAPVAQGEIDDITVPASLVRKVVNIAGGSSNTDVATFTSGPTTEGGIGTGQIAREMFGGIGMRPIGYEWVYGAEPRKPFTSHVELDGQQFDSLTDESLRVAPEDDWLGTDHYHPGDHSGCLCTLAPLFAEIPTEPEPVPEEDLVPA